MAQVAKAEELEGVSDIAEQQQDAQALLKLHEFVRRYVAADPESKRDVLNDRYRIELSTPLSDFDSSTATAYAATDLLEPGKQLIAQVCRPGTVQRHRAIELLLSLNHPYILPLIAAGVVEMSRPEEERFVIFYQRPAGTKLSNLLSQAQNHMTVHYLCERIIAPLAAAIQQFSELDIAHGTLNADNIYFTDIAVLGPCVSEPCGYSQPFYYEPLERMQAQPAGKGEGTTAQDYYALAVLVLTILHGQAHFSNLSQNELALAILKDGAYNALTRQREVPEIFYDFFRGLLSQHADDRWTFRYIKLWLDGKRYNVLSAPPPIEAVRPFEFVDIQVNTRRELAHLFATHWEQIAIPVQNGQLSHWVSVSLRNKELADNVARISRAVADLGVKNELQLTEMLMRIILLLDPEGPIRVKNIAMHLDGIDALCAELYAKKAHTELQFVAKFVEFNMANFWLEQQRKDAEYTIPTPVNAILIRLDRLRACIRNTSLGFGLERLLYELNPNYPCQSSLFAGRHIATLPALLRNLDRIAPNMAKSEDPIDRHIAAFIAAKLGIQHEVRLHDLAAIPSLAGHRAIIALYLLSMAQQKCGNLHLPGLTHWLALRIFPALESIHSRTLKHDLKEQIIEQAQSGYTQLLAECVLNADYASADQAGFIKAWQLYQRNAIEIENYRKGALIDQHSARVGFSIARAFAYVGLMFSMFTVWQGY